MSDLTSNLQHSSPSVRRAAIDELVTLDPAPAALYAALAQDPSWINRRALAQGLPLDPQLCAVALGDPHWRVRHAVTERLIQDFTDAPERWRALRAEIACDDPRVAGALAYVAWRLAGAPDTAPASFPAPTSAPEPTPTPTPTLPDAPARPSFWSDDPAVLHRRVSAMGPALREHRVWLPTLLGHDRPAIRTIAVRALLRWGTDDDLRRCADAWQDPRQMWLYDSFRRLAAGLDVQRLKVLRRAGAHRPWFLAALIASDDRPVDIDSEREPRPPAAPTEVESNIERAIGPTGTLPRVRLGRGGPAVTRMGISGHYGLPADGYRIAIERGVDFFFWEPPYWSQTRFFRDQLTPAVKAELTVAAGTFDMAPKTLARDVHRALKQMKLERLGLFFLFWVRDEARLAPDVIAELERLQQVGDIGGFGLSTHQYELAERALADSRWSIIMLRHSVAHRTAELCCLPLAAQREVGVITFSNLCYGRLLSPSDASAAQLYRYSLDTPGVSACLSAPGTVAHLEANLSALTMPALPAAARARLLARGAEIYRDNRWFSRCIRRVSGR